MMNKILYTLLALVLLVCNAHAKEYYVSLTGKDTNPGSKEQPFLTIEQAQEAVRKYKEKQSEKEQITVWLRGGVYQLNESLRFGENDSGSESHPVVYQAYPGEKVNCIGGMHLPNQAVKKVTSPGVLNQLADPSVKSKLREINLKELGINDYGVQRQFGFGLPVVNASMELFINGQKMQLARYPNQGYMKIGKVLDSGSVPRQNDYNNIRGGTFEYTDERHANWAGLGNVWLKGTFNRGYADDRIQVKEIRKDTKQVELASPHMYGIAGGEDFQQYFAENIFAEIDSPGEYYIDEEEGILYLYPPENIGQAEIAVSVLESPMVVLMNASNIEFRNIIFEATRGIGIYIEGGRNNKIRGCILRNIGTVAVVMGQGAKQTFPNLTHDEYEGVPVSEDVGSLAMQIYNHSGWDRKAGYRHGIQSCEIYNTGTGGVILSGGSKKKLIPGGCYVDNCRIYDFQTRIATQGTAISVDGCGNKVSHNEIFNSEQQAIWVRGNNHVFEYNELHHIAMNTNDASALYMGRDPSDQGQIIRYNFFHHIGRPDRELTMGVYFDDSACGALVEGNVFYKVASYGTIYSNAGSDLTIRNNIFIEGYGPALQLKSRWWDRLVNRWERWFTEGSLFMDRLTKEVDIKSPPYSTQYPNLVNWIDKTDDGHSYYGMYPSRNIMERNVIVNYPETSRLVGINADFAFQGNFATTQDPGFEDASTMNFNLKEGSVVYERIPDFNKIPFGKMGLEDNPDRVWVRAMMNDK